MRRLFLCLLVPVLLQACATEPEGLRDRGRLVIDTYQDPLVRGGVLEAAAVGDPGDPALSEGEGLQPEAARLSNLKPGERPPLSTDEAGLWMQGDRWEENLLASGRVVEDPELTAYVRDIVCRLARSYCSDLRVYVVSRPGFNAKMAPNGAMEVWTGALLRLRSEAELAAVIGHEIGHFLRRHSIQKVRATRTRISGFLDKYAGTSTVRAGYFDLVGSLTGFSRENEREADGYGLRLLAEAGYDPKAVPTLWARLDEEFKKVAAYRNRSAFYATHPLLAERSEILDGLARDVRRNMTAVPASGRDVYLEMVLPRRAGYLQDELAEREFEQLEALLDGLLGDDDPNPAELHFFKGEVYRLRNGAGDREKAWSAYEASLSAEGEPPAALHRSRGLLLRRRGETPAAVAAFEAYLAAAPGAEDRALVEDLIAGLEAR